MSPPESGTPAADTTGAKKCSAAPDQRTAENNVAHTEHSAKDFLVAMRPGPWALVAIGERKIEGRTFDNADAAAEWVAKRNGRMNLYWTVARLKGPVNPKAAKEDVESSCYLWVDLDPRDGEDHQEERKRILALLNTNLPAGVPAPSAIVDSGGGFQAYWRLKEPAKPEDVEARNIALENALRGDRCHNADRIMRLPGTVNIPNANKRKKGRTKTPAGVVRLGDEVYALEKFAAAPAPTNDAAPVARVEDINALPISKRLKDIAKQGRDPEEPKEGDNSRSAWLFDFVCNALREGLPEETVYAILMDPDYRISESVLELKGGARKYALRQIDKGKSATTQFEINEAGKVQLTISNLRLALDKLGVRVRYNMFSSRYIVDGLDGRGPEFDDHAERALRVEIEEQFRVKFNRDRVADVVFTDAFDDRFHPVREYMAGLTWDGEARTERWLIDCAGAADTDYVRAVSRIVLVAAVRRIYEPGAKFDELIVLEGAQGGFKSSALRRLAVREEWFTDNLPLSGDSKVAVEQTQGKWIVEAAELQGRGRGGIDELKNFLSMPFDRTRLSYERTAQDYPRQWVAFGTTNKGQYLKDETGNRRFWPVRVDRFDIARLTPGYVDQLWAEARALEREGASIRLDPALYDAAASEQRGRQEQDPWEDELANLVGDGPLRVPTNVLWEHLQVSVDRQTPQLSKRLARVMRGLGFERRTVRVDGLPKSGYVRGDDGPLFTRPLHDQTPF